MAISFVFSSSSSLRCGKEDVDFHQSKQRIEYFLNKYSSCQNNNNNRKHPGKKDSYLGILICIPSVLPWDTNLHSLCLALGTEINPQHKRFDTIRSQPRKPIILDTGNLFLLSDPPLHCLSIQHAAFLLGKKLPCHHSTYQSLTVLSDKSTQAGESSQRHEGERQMTVELIAWCNRPCPSIR